jgi:hypothetical protein
MIMKKAIPLVFMFLFMSLIHVAKAQTAPDSAKAQIETTDGNEYIGIILNQTKDSIKIKTDKIGTITISQSEIRNISNIKTIKAKDGSYWLDNPQVTRYFCAPNGYNLKQGEAFYQNVWVLFNQATLGITNRFSAGIGMVPLFMFSSPATPVWLTAKISMPVGKNKFNLGVGMLLGTVLGERSNTGFGILYGIATFGAKDKNLNLGLGWAYADGEIAQRPTINISGMIRTGPKGYFITENYIISTSDDIAVLSIIGGRRLIKHTGLDFGLMIPLEKNMDSFIAVPWLGITIPFGKNTK